MNKIFKIATKAIIENNENKYLILKKTIEENLNDACSNLFDLPGGRVEYGEDLENSLKREIKEETSLIAKKIKLLSVNSVIKKDKIQLIVITYLCTCISYECILSEEHNDFIWLNKEEILNSYLYPKWIKDLFLKL